MENVQKTDGCEPNEPAPQQETEYCEGTFKMEKCCCKLNSRTFIVSIGPQTEPQLAAFTQNTVSNYEANGYVVLAHSLVDTGSGWLLGLTIGWTA